MPDSTRLLAGQIYRLRSQGDGHQHLYHPTAAVMRLARSTDCRVLLHTFAENMATGQQMAVYEVLTGPTAGRCYCASLSLFDGMFEMVEDPAAPEKAVDWVVSSGL